MSLGDFIIRNALAGDAKGLHNLHTEIYQENTWFVNDAAASEAMIARRIRVLEPEQALYLVVVDPVTKILCAWLELHTLAPKKLAHVASLTLAVKATHRQKGIGLNLMQEAQNWAHSKRLLKLSLNVRSKNSAAIKLYEKLGYRLEGTEKSQIKTETGFEDNLIMAKFLEEGIELHREP